jgi:hypothetical protein
MTVYGRDLQLIVVLKENKDNEATTAVDCGALFD